RGLEPPTSASRTRRANRAAPLPVVNHPSIAPARIGWPDATTASHLVRRSIQPRTMTNGSARARDNIGKIVDSTRVARVAQRIEQGRPKPCVGGSTPSAGAKFAIDQYHARDAQIRSAVAWM